MSFPEAGSPPWEAVECLRVRSPGGGRRPGSQGQPSGRGSPCPCTPALGPAWFEDKARWVFSHRTPLCSPAGTAGPLAPPLLLSPHGALGPSLGRGPLPAATQEAGNRWASCSFKTSLLPRQPRYNVTERLPRQRHQLSSLSLCKFPSKWGQTRERCPACAGSGRLPDLTFLRAPSPATHRVSMGLALPSQPPLGPMVLIKLRLATENQPTVWHATENQPTVWHAGPQAAAGRSQDARLPFCVPGALWALGGLLTLGVLPGRPLCGLWPWSLSPAGCVPSPASAWVSPHRPGGPGVPLC